MFRIYSAQILGALAMLASAIVAHAAPFEVDARDADLTSNVIVCSGSLNPPAGCVSIPIGSDACTSLTGGLAFLNKEISNAEVPDGFVCTFFEAAGCTAPANSGDVVLTAGDWDFFEVPGDAGTVDFNDLTSSFSCSPL